MRLTQLFGVLRSNAHSVLAPPQEDQATRLLRSACFMDREELRVADDSGESEKKQVTLRIDQVRRARGRAGCQAGDVRAVR